MRHLINERFVTVPEGVTVTVKSRRVTVKGPRGVIKKDFTHAQIELVKMNDGNIKATMYRPSRKEAAIIRTVCAHIENAIKGVTKGYEYKMRLVYAHFPINVNIVDDGKCVEIRNFIGEKIVRRVPMLEGVTIALSTAQKDELILTGNDIDNVSQSAATIQQSTAVKNKDIRKFLDGIYVSESGLLVKD